MAALSLRDGARVGCALLAVVACAAIAVTCSSPAEARGQLGFDFPEVPATIAKSVAILVNNVRILCGVLVATAFAQFVHRRGMKLGRVPALTVLALCDAVLTISATAHAALVGAGVGAYGRDMVSALLPHAPFELLAYSVALGGLIRAHRARVPARDLGMIAAIGLAALTVGAALETLVQLD